MSDVLPEDAWTKEFQTANSRPLLSSLQRRLVASTTHVHALAELYRERALIEQEYSTKLGKLARAAESGQLLGKGGVEWDRHGGEAKLWDAVLSDVQETASAHGNLAATLKSDFEAPIRDLPTKIVPWRRIHDQEGSLDRALKDYDRASAKLEKTKKQNKIAELQDELRNAQTTIASLTPMVYTTYQRIDEERLRGLKEVCVRWVTGRADVAAREGQRAEQAAVGLLSWEPQDEVVAVGVRLGSAAGGSGPRPSGVETPPQASTPTRRMSTATAGTGTSDFTPRMQRANGSNTNVNQHHGHGGGAFGGIKSMLARRPTVAGRQRSGSEATSVRSNRRTPGGDNFEQMGEGHATDRQGGTLVRERPDPIPEAPTSSREPSGTQHSRAPQVDAEGYTIAPADRHRPLWEEPNESIPSRARTKSTIGGGAGAVAGAAAAGAATVALPSALFAAGQRSSSPTHMQDNQSTDSGSIAEAPTRLNLAMAQAPIEESEAERKAALAKMQQTLSMAPQPPTRRTTIARGRREARHTMQASANEAGPVPAVHMAALARMGDEERLTDESNLSPSQPDLTRRRSTSSMSSRNPFESPGLSAPSPALESSGAPILDRPPSVRQGGLAAAGVAAGGAGAVLAAQLTGASARSGANGNLPPAAAPAAPFTASPVAMQQSLPVTERQAPTAPASSVTTSTGVPGLRASITETVHALMRQNQLLRTVVNGEIRLSLAATPNQPLPPPGSAIHIRLTEFDALESIAPNPAFLSQVPDSPGEYYLDTDKVAQATAQPEDPSSPQGPVLFRYQVLIPEGSEGSMAPVILNPAFQIKNGETRMILHYRVAPNSGVSGLNLAVAFPSEPEVTTTQSKPISGTWSDTPDGNRAITYSVAPQEGVDNKIIARFLTGGNLAPHNIDAHFVCPGRILSSIGIETVDDAQAVSGWNFAGINRAVVSGKYIGEPSVNP